MPKKVEREMGFEPLTLCLKVVANQGVTKEDN